MCFEVAAGSFIPASGSSSENRPSRPDSAASLLPQSVSEA